MVRTKASAATTRVAGAKAPSKVATLANVSEKKGKWSNACGGNPYLPRETPEWQKEITKFFSPKEKEESDMNEVTSAASKESVSQSVELNESEQQGTSNSMEKMDENNRVTSNGDSVNSEGSDGVNDSA